MGGMKFRRSCYSCGAAFFTTDRKAGYCPKCARSKPAEPSFDKGDFQADKSQSRFSNAPSVQPKPKEKKPPRPAKTDTLTPEVQEQIIELYKSLSVDELLMLHEINTKISNQLWVNHKLVKGVVHNFRRRSIQPQLSEEQRASVIEMYRQFVKTMQRPERGRRRTISASLGLSLKSVCNTVRELTISESEKSPTPILSRDQLFAIEKLYWDELKKQEHNLAQIPDLIANQLGFATSWQVLRWIDMLNDDESKLGNVEDPPPDIQQQILKLYADYLAATEPPDKGLHSTIAKQLEGVNPKQIHKVLGHYRRETLSNYPLV
jgi:hypothetical protein